MQTPELLQVLQPVWPEPRKRPVPLHVPQRPEPRHEPQVEELRPPCDELFSYEEPPMAQPVRRMHNKLITTTRSMAVSFSSADIPPTLVE